MNLHEEKMVKALENGEHPDLEFFGGASSLLENAPVIGASPLMPEFIRLALTTLDLGIEELNLLDEFICQCIENAKNDISLKESIDLFYQGRPLPDDKTERCFNRFMALVSDNLVMPMTRVASLDGAFRLAISNRKMQLRFLTLLLDIRADDEPIFLAHAAKMMGVAYSYWREEELLKKLRFLADIEGVEDEASFELGMAKLIQGLEMDEREKAEKAFVDSKYWFSQSLTYREQRPDAAAYNICLEILIAFVYGETPNKLSQIADALPEIAFQIQAWHTQQELPLWLGARYSEISFWNLLATKLKGLSQHLEEISWYEPAVIVEEYVVACYTASRSILKRTTEGGIEALIRPRLEGSLTQQASQVHLVKEWLAHNLNNEWEAEVRELCKKLDELISGGKPNHPFEATIVRPSIVALLEQANIPKAISETTLSAIIIAMKVHLDNLSYAEQGLIELCMEAAQEFVDYRNNPNGKALFDTVLIWTICFLRNRLEITQEKDPKIKYLFEQKGKDLPMEDDLQKDYYHFILSNLAGTRIEVSDIGSGRADLFFSYKGERIITETKRETEDSSFEALKSYYSAQTTDYQNVGIRLAFLLVLDLTEVRVEGTPHISTLVKPCTIIRKNETEPRCVVIFKVPGRRLRPSDLTKVAKGK